jgi:hypothetical protein
LGKRQPRRSLGDVGLCELSGLGEVVRLVKQETLHHAQRLVEPALELQLIGRDPEFAHGFVDQAGVGSPLGQLHPQDHVVRLNLHGLAQGGHCLRGLAPPLQAGGRQLELLYGIRHQPELDEQGRDLQMGMDALG